MQEINYKDVAIQALHEKDLKKLKELHQLKDKTQIFFIDSIDKLQALTFEFGTGYLFANHVKTYLDNQFIAAVLNNELYKYENIYKPIITANEMLEINKELEQQY